MVIDFEQIKEQVIQGFKGGVGELRTKSFADDKCKIMLSTLKPGASSGLHTHEQNCEIIYVLDGTLTNKNQKNRLWLSISNRLKNRSFRALRAE